LPLVVLGAVFLVFYPLGITWSDYGFAVGIAVVLGFLIHRRLRLTIVEYVETDEERVWAVRQVWKKIRWRRSAKRIS
jgi:hypothetical protein